jgi:hypothetical protein
MEKDVDLLAAVKQAKCKKMFFAFIPKGGADGTLLLSKAKLPPKAIAEAKMENGGGTPVTGKCFVDGKNMVFHVAKAAPATMGPALKKVIKRDTGLVLEPHIQLAGAAADAEEQADDADTTTGPAPAAAPAAPAAAPAEPAAAAARGSKPAANGSTAFNLATYQAARQKVIAGLKAFAGKVAATKHKSAVGVLEEINSILVRLPANPGPNDVDKLHDYIANDRIITDVEKVPDHFHDLDVREPLLSAWK